MAKQKCWTVFFLIVAWCSPTYAGAVPAIPINHADESPDAPTSAGYLEASVHAQLERVGPRLNLSLEQ